MVFRYLSSDVLKGFDTYKYSSIDNSPLSTYVTHPFWNWTVQFMPLWLAPNLMTFAGFMILVFNYVLVLNYDWSFTAANSSLPDGGAVVPPWVWLVCGLGTFVSHTLDGCDGKQARRTQSSTPLGELFDHGLDSWATLFLPCVLYSVFGRGDTGVPSIAYLVVIMCVMFSFILSHWEKCSTGILYLPWTYDMSQLGTALIFMIHYFCGPSWIKIILPVVHVTFAKLGLSVAAVCLGIFGFTMSFLNVHASYKQRTGRMLPFSECVRPLLPCAIWFTSIIAWVLLSPSNIIEGHPRLVYYLTGTVFSNFTCRVIVNQMSKTRCEAFNLLILPVLVIVPVVGCYGAHPFVLANEATVLYVYCVVATLAHIHYGVSVVNEMAEHFNIYVFSLAKPESNGAGERKYK